MGESNRGCTRSSGLASASLRLRTFAHSAQRVSVREITTFARPRKPRFDGLTVGSHLTDRLLNTLIRLSSKCLASSLETGIPCGSWCLSTSSAELSEETREGEPVTSAASPQLLFLLPLHEECGEMRGAGVSEHGDGGGGRGGRGGRREAVAVGVS